MSRHALRSHEMFVGLTHLSNLTGVDFFNRPTDHTGRHRRDGRCLLTTVHALHRGTILYQTAFWRRYLP